MTASRPEAALEYEISLPTNAGDGATLAVLLHGRGSHMGDLQGLRAGLPTDWVLVTPQAPFPSAPWGYGPGWAWYRYEEADRLVVTTLAQSLAAIDAFFEELPDLLGLDPGRIVLGGFSQGGTTSLAYALTRPGAVAAVLNFSGFLASHVVLDESGGAPPSTPIFWGHGTEDPAIPISLAHRGRERLTRARAAFVARDYPIGHWIVPEELRDAVEMVDSLG